MRSVGGAGDAGLPAWRRSFAAPAPDARVHAFARPPLGETLGLLPVAWRLMKFVSAERREGRTPYFDVRGWDLRPPHPGPIGGVPLGGMGSGSVTRSYRGQFRRWSMNPGQYVYGNVEADQFSVRVSRGGAGGAPPQACVLSQRDEDPQQQQPGLRDWEWGLDPDRATYAGLFPRAWTRYTQPVAGVNLECRQVSPVIADNYVDSCLPCAVFVWTIENTADVDAGEGDDADVSIMFTWQNGDGAPDHDDDVTGGHRHASFGMASPPQSPHLVSASEQPGETVSGVLMGHVRHVQQVSPGETSAESKMSSPASSSSSSCCSARKTAQGPVFMATSSFAVAALGTANNSAAAASSSSSSEALDDPTDDDRTSARVSTCPFFLINELPHRRSTRRKARNDLKLGSSRSTTNPRNLPASEARLLGAEKALFHAINATKKRDGVQGGVTTVDGGTAAAASDISGVSSVRARRRQRGGGGTASSSLMVESTIAAGDDDEEEDDDDPETIDYAEIPAGDGGLELSASALWRTFREHGELPTVVQHLADPAPEGENDDDDATDAADADTAAARAAFCRLQATDVQCTRASLPGETVGSAVCARVRVPAGRSRQVVFALAWDSPTARFGCGRAQRRFYSQFAGDSGLQAGTLASYALTQYVRWEREIEAWQAQKRLLEHRLPSTFRSMLFNEAYFLVDGGTQWLLSDPGDEEAAAGGKEGEPSDGKLGRSWLRPVHDDQLVELAFPAEWLRVSMTAAVIRMSQRMAVLRRRLAEQETANGDPSLVGQFLYLEGHEYLMYNTYDVHFYASYALISLFPQLQLSLQRDFARAVFQEDDTVRALLGDGEERPRKVSGVVPHDLGSPFEDPHGRVNIYHFQDVSRWKDLGPKFVIQVCRDYVYTQCRTFLEAVYPAVLRVMESTATFDRDDDGMIENEGFPDQTYDIWSVRGVSAYTGGLWCAACAAASHIASEMHEAEQAAQFRDQWSRSCYVYNETLWNGSYFLYDSSGHEHSDSIMADQLAGQWCSRVCGLDAVTTPARASKALALVHRMNVERFGGEQRMGAVNGMRPDGSVDNSCLQSREVWTGTTYGLAATMLMEAVYLAQEAQRNTRSAQQAMPPEATRLVRMAFDTARGIHDAGWQRFGYWFATPEAWEQSGNYRSLGYMRPLSIWAMHDALEHAEKLGVLEWVLEAAASAEDPQSELGSGLEEQDDNAGRLHGVTHGLSAQRSDGSEEENREGLLAGGGYASSAAGSVSGSGSGGAAATSGDGSVRRRRQQM